jgi:hypothetical protein
MRFHSQEKKKKFVEVSKLFDALLCSVFAEVLLVLYRCRGTYIGVSVYCDCR